MKNEKSNNKKRNWGFVVYPESAPSNWKELLIKTGLPAVISPLHDRDINEGVGENKKPHWHVIVCYNGPTSFNVVQSVTDKFNSPMPVPIESMKGAYRYLTHKDNPEKFQYDEKDIERLNGFSIADFVELTRNEVNVIKKELQKLIRDLCIYEYAEFMDYLVECGSDSDYDVACNNTIFFDRYISSRRHSREVKDIMVDKDTGEILG